MSLSRDLDSKEEEKFDTTPAWKEEYDPFCVKDRDFDINKLFIRYRNFYDVITARKKQTVKGQTLHPLPQLDDSYGTLGRIFTNFRLFYEKLDKITFSKTKAERLSHISLSKTDSETCISYLISCVEADIREIRDNQDDFEGEDFEKAKNAISNLEWHHVQIANLQNNPKAIINLAKEIFETDAQVYRKTALHIIQAYRKSLSAFNYYGRKRADELELSLNHHHSTQSLDAIKSIIANFIKDGKTASDHRVLNFFRSPSLASGIDDSSLRGMLINQFMPVAYYKATSHNNRIVNIRSLVKNDVEEIKRYMISPSRDNLNQLELNSKKPLYKRPTPR
jgi:hypothetical protein